MELEKLFAPKKGKPLTKGQKQIDQENRDTLRWYAIMAVVPILVSFYLATITSSISAVIIQIFAIGGMYYMVKLGLDLNLTDGFADKLKDLITTTSFCVVGSMYSNGFWFLWLWIPAYHIYKIWTGIVAPWIFEPAPEGPPPEVAEKKRRKMERKMARINR